jgi:prolipoprotein diacylglyceryltransferase
MTFPVFIRLGPLAIHPHWLFETLAYTLAGYVYSRDRRRRGDVIETRTRWWIIGAAALGGLVGSRLLSLAEDPVALARHWSDPAFLVEGKTIVGGLIGGLVAVEWIKRGSPSAASDAFCPGWPIAPTASRRTCPGAWISVTASPAIRRSCTRSPFSPYSPRFW